MKCNRYACLAIAQLICYALQSQYYFSSNNRPEPDLMWEAGLSAGAMNCLTDIGGTKGPGKKFIKDINWNQTQPCAGVMLSATWKSLYAIRLQATFGSVKGNDKVLQSSEDVSINRYLRNLHFKSKMLEVALQGDLHVLPLIDHTRDLPLFSPYITAGVGFFHFNPQALLNNQWVSLPPLHTEGQGFREYPQRNNYSTFTWCVPTGIGVKYDASRLVNGRFELVYRFTGTDYLDDVSQQYIDPLLFSKYLSPANAVTAAALADRSAELSGGAKNEANAIRGNPANKDAYFSAMFTISIALGRLPGK